MRDQQRASRSVCAFAMLVVVLTFGGCGADESDSEAEPSPTKSEAASSFAERYPRAQILADCLREKGWDIEINEATGSVEFDGVTSQQEQYEADTKECMPEDKSIPLEELNDEQWTIIYEWQLKTADCLRAEGIAVDEAPSKQVFIDRYTTADSWTAYKSVGDVNEERLNELNSRCPQTSNHPSLSR